MKLNIVLIVIIGILTFFIIFGHNGLLKYQELSKIRQKYEDKISDTNAKVKELNDELKQVKKDKSYLEMLIKKDLNMKKADEDEYILEHHNNQKKQPEKDNADKNGSK